jgi:hypothetical protein
MNRRSFFKFLGIGATAAVAPKMLAERTIDKVVSVKGSYSHGPFIFPLPWGDYEVYEEPREGYDYSIGVETRYGLGGEPSVVSVMRVGNGNRPCVQVAEFVSTQHDPAELVPIIAKIARRYGKKCIDTRGPLIVIEHVQAPGDTVQALLKIMGFKRFHKATSAKGIEKDGWYTTKFSDPIMMNRFNSAVEEGWYEPKSKALHQALSLFDKNRNKHSLVRAAAQSYVGFHAFDAGELKRNG